MPDTQPDTTSSLTGQIFVIITGGLCDRTAQYCHRRITRAHFQIHPTPIHSPHFSQSRSAFIHQWEHLHRARTQPTIHA